MIILGIDTSCDDTCIAILKSKSGGFEILSNIVSSQVKLHAKYGGVFPSLAKREHIKNLPLVLKKCLKESKNHKIDAVAVTTGPGLEPCLWQGINFAVDLAQKLKVPIIPVNHVEAHIIANFINHKPLFPAVCLVVSGGHTQLILMEKIGKYRILGETLDDAAGECFDKAARILGLEYPGGPIISSLASKKRDSSSLLIQLPRPIMHQKNYDFSFSGLKTAVLYDFKNRPEKTRKSKEYIEEMAFKIQQAIIDVLIYKTLKAVKNLRVKTIILGGGVTANEELKKQFKERIKKEIPHSTLYIPDSKFCTDNAAMIAATAFYHLDKKTNSFEKLSATGNLRI